MRQFTYQHTGFCRPRQPRASPHYQLVEENYDSSERVYAARYQATCGFWRPAIV